MDTNRKMGRPGALAGVLPEEIQHLTGTSELHSKSSLTFSPSPSPTGGLCCSPAVKHTWGAVPGPVPRGSSHVLTLRGRWYCHDR